MDTSTTMNHSQNTRDIVLFEDSEQADDSILDDSVSVTDFERSFEGHSKTITAICLVGDGMLASASKDKTIRLWDIERIECIRTFEGHSLSVSSLCTYCGNLASASHDKMIRVWNLNTGLSTVFMGHMGPVLSLCAVGNLLVSTSEDHTIRIWNDNGICVQKFTGHTTSVAVCGLQKGIFVSTWGFDARIWDAEKGAHVRNLDGGGGYVIGVCVVNKRIVTAAKQIRVWDWENGTVLRTLNGHNNRVHEICSLHGGLLASTGSRMIHVWNPESGEILTSFAENSKSLCPSKVLCQMGAGYFASASDSCEFEIRNVYMNCPVEVMMRLSEDARSSLNWPNLCVQARDMDKPLHMNYILTQMGHSIQFMKNCCFLGEKYTSGKQWYTVIRIMGDLMYVSNYGQTIERKANDQQMMKTEHALVFKEAFGAWANETDMELTYAFSHQDEAIDWGSPAFNVHDMTPEEIFKFRVKRSKFWTADFTEQSVLVLSEEMREKMHAREIGLRRLGYESMKMSVPYGLRGKFMEIIQLWKKLSSSKSRDSI